MYFAVRWYSLLQCSFVFCTEWLAGDISSICLSAVFASILLSLSLFFLPSLVLLLFCSAHFSDSMAEVLRKFCTDVYSVGIYVSCL